MLLYNESVWQINFVAHLRQSVYIRKGVVEGEKRTEASFYACASSGKYWHNNYFDFPVNSFLYCVARLFFRFVMYYYVADYVLFVLKYIVAA
jgi:hypothetical protein